MLIGLCGRIGAGKNVVASIVQELYPEMNWQEKGFADKLRQVAEILTGIPAASMKEQAIKEQLLGDEWGVEINDENSYLFQVPTLRQFLQVLGTNAVRDKLHTNSWVNALMFGYQPYVERKFNGNLHEKYWCADCASCHRDFSGNKRQRVCNDCIDAGYKEWPNWLITDTRFQNEYDAITSRGGICIRIIRPDNPYPQSNHESETALDGVEMLTIINDGSIEQLRLRVKEVFDPIVKNLGK